MLKGYETNINFASNYPPASNGHIEKRNKLLKEILFKIPNSPNGVRITN